MTTQELPPPPVGKKGWPWDETVAGNGGLSGIPPLPRISITTPSFNQGIFLEETIRSVLLQNYPLLEYVIIDGGSTDESVDIIKKYEPWLDHWVSERDSGQSEAINKGWLRSRGDILAWINSDDLYHPGALFKVGKFFEQHPDVDMLYGDCDIIDENGAFIRPAPTQPFDLKPLVCNKWFIPQQSTFIRRRVFEQIGRIDQDLHLIMDWEYWLRIALNHFKIAYFPERLASFRRYEQAKTSLQNETSGREKLRVLNGVFGNRNFAASIGPYRRQAFGYVNKWTGEACRKNGKRGVALYYFIKAALHSPYLLKDPYFIKTVRSCLPL
ncbi:MAG: glycosyltransferase family 2 protein [Desulfobacterales bacterium]